MAIGGERELERIAGELVVPPAARLAHCRRERSGQAAFAVAAAGARPPLPRQRRRPRGRPGRRARAPLLAAHVGGQHRARAGAGGRGFAASARRRPLAQLDAHEQQQGVAAAWLQRPARGPRLLVEPTSYESYLMCYLAQ